MNNVQQMINDLSGTGLKVLWAVDGPNDNRVEKIGALMSCHVIVNFMLYECGKYELLIPVVHSEDKRRIKSKVIDYLKSQGC